MSLAQILSKTTDREGGERGELTESESFSGDGMELKARTQLGPYLLLDLVGEGSLGRVFKAEDTVHHRLVAVKILHEKLRQDPTFTGVFHRELMMQQRVSHPHLVGYVDGCYEPPVYYMVTQWIDGWTLRQLIKHYGRIPPLVSLAIFWQMTQGLDGLHLHDMIHADLSAANIMIERSGKVFLTDFSLALDAESDSYRNMIIGTPGYYSPEHLTKDAVVAASDIYVLGLLLFEMIEGRRIIPALDAKTHHKQIVDAMRSPQVLIRQCTDDPLRQALQGFIQPLLEPVLSKRVHRIEKVAQYARNLLVRYGIYDPYSAVRQYLRDGQFTIPLFADHKDQDIYRSAKPYSIDDLQLLARN